MRFIHLVFIILLTYCHSAFATGSPNERFNQWLTRTMKDYQVPAVSIVVIRDYKIDWVGTFGVKNISTEEPITDTTLFQAGSISKPLTAMAVLLAAQDEELDLDDNVNDLLITWKLPDNQFTKKEDVTVKALLNHTSGINVPGFLGYAQDAKIPTLLQVLDGIPPANSPPIRVQAIPGKHYAYSGGGYVILQLLLQNHFNKSFNQLMNDLVLGPLSMSNSTFDQPLPSRLSNTIANPYYPGYVSVKGGPHIYIEQAAAGLWTTPFDLAKFIISIQESLRGNPYQLLKPKFAKMMVTPVKGNMGLGVMANVDKYGQPTENGRYFMHLGQNEGYRSLFIAHVSKGYGAIIMTNMAPEAKLVMSGKVEEDGFLNNVLEMIADMEQWY